MTERKLLRQFGAEIKFARRMKGITQVELARRIDVSQSTIAQLETGAKSTTLMNLWKLERELGKIWIS